jgi:hypothetical protein
MASLIVTVKFCPSIIGRAQRDRDDEALVDAMRANPEGSIGDWTLTVPKSRTSVVSALHRLRDAGLAESVESKWRLVEEPAPREPPHVGLRRYPPPARPGRTCTPDGAGTCIRPEGPSHPTADLRNGRPTSPVRRLYAASRAAIAGGRPARYARPAIAC